MMRKTRMLVTTILMVIILAITVAGGLILVGKSGIQTWATSGASMSPTYLDGDVMYGRKTLEPKPNDVVVVRKPDGWRDGHKGRPNIVKRVIAVEGMTICIQQNGRIYDSCDDNADLIDDTEDTYQAGCSIVEPMRIKIPKGKLFIRGDNVNISYDSRHAACVGEDPLVDVDSVEMKVDGSIPFGKLTSRLTPRGSDGGIDD